MSVARVGTGVTGTADAASNNVAASAKSTTTGNAITVAVKWEVSGVTLTSVTDTAGNTYTITDPAQRAHSTGGEPHGALAHCENGVGNASNIVTANFSAGTATFRRIIVEEWSGVASVSALDGTPTSNEGTGTSHSTGAITTTVPGLVFAGIAGFTSMSGFSALGTPTFTLGNTLTDAYAIHLLSSTGQSCSAAGSVSSGNAAWVMLALALKEASASGTKPQLPTLGMRTDKGGLITKIKLPQTISKEGHAPAMPIGVAPKIMQLGDAPLGRASGLGALVRGIFTPPGLQVPPVQVRQPVTDSAPPLMARLGRSALGALGGRGTLIRGITLPTYLPDSIATTSQSVVPGAGTIVITGFAPTIAQPQTANPDVGALTITGPVPTVVQNTLVNPGVGSIAITGFAPSVVQNTLVNPGVGAITLTGPAPTVVQNVNVVPGAGAITLTGYVPLVVQDSRVNPDAGTITLTGFAPTVSQTGAGTQVNPDAGTVTLTGFAPTIAQPQTANPDAGALAITGYAPTILQDSRVNPGAGALTLTGFAPVVAQTNNQAVAPGAGALALTGYAPTVEQAASSQNITPDVGTLVITGYAPSVVQAGFVNPIIFGPGATKKQRAEAKAAPPAYNAHKPVSLEPSKPKQVVSPPVVNDDEDIFSMMITLVAQGFFDGEAAR